MRRHCFGRPSPSGALIPATGFFEWQKRADGKQPYRFRIEDLQPSAFAGLWEFARITVEETSLPPSSSVHRIPSQPRSVIGCP